MDLTVGLILIFVWAGLNGLIAAKRGRSALTFFGVSLIPVLPLVIVTALLSRGNGTLMGWSAFLSPLVAFIASIAVKSGAEAAAASGSYRGLVRCPFCAEPIRREAVKCKHCASDLTVPAATAG